MKSETLVQQHPPTPPAVGTELHPSLHSIPQYNVGRNFVYDGPQQYGSVYDSPGLALHEGLSPTSSRMGSQSGEIFNLGVQYGGYGDGPGYYQDGQFNGLANDVAVYPGSPPTPTSTTDHDDAGRRTRSGRPVALSRSPQQEEKPRPKATPKSKKAKAGKSEKPKTPKLTAPLSILTKDMAGIPVRNMEEWVNRSVETRRKEVEKRNGYVTRPMNSFMLYRSAYAERTKQWCLQNNHQIVSSVSGESWPLEPPAVRDLYNEYAKIERMNHQNAHPTYKFSPSKTSAPVRKRKGDFSDEESSDLEDAEWSPGQGRSKNRPKRPDRSLSYTSAVNPEFFGQGFAPNTIGMHKPSWDMANEGRPVPMPMTHDDLYNQYYQTSMHPNMGMHSATVEDMRLQRADTPGASMQFSPDHALLGLPGGNAVDLMQQMDSNTSTPLVESQVDPMLLAFDTSQHHDVGSAVVQHPDFRNSHTDLIDRGLDQHNINDFLAGAAQNEFPLETWQPDPHAGQSEQESEFEKWMLVLLFDRMRDLTPVSYAQKSA